MGNIRRLIFEAIALAVCAFLFGGCETSQQVHRRQEVQELKKTVETQQAKIDELQRQVETTTSMLFKVTGELEKCRGKSEITKEKKQNTKTITKRGKRTRVSEAMRRAVKEAKAKKKRGCACRKR